MISGLGSRLTDVNDARHQGISPYDELKDDFENYSSVDDESDDAIDVYDKLDEIDEEGKRHSVVLQENCSTAWSKEPDRYSSHVTMDVKTATLPASLPVKLIPLRKQRPISDPRALYANVDLAKKRKQQHCTLPSKLPSAFENFSEDFMVVDNTTYDIDGNDESVDGIIDTNELRNTPAVLVEDNVPPEVILEENDVYGTAEEEVEGATDLGEILSANKLFRLQQKRAETQSPRRNPHF